MPCVQRVRELQTAPLPTHSNHCGRNCARNWRWAPYQLSSYIAPIPTLQGLLGPNLCAAALSIVQLSAREQGLAKAHAGCRLISDTDSVIVLVVSNPGKSRPNRPQGRVFHLVSLKPSRTLERGSSGRCFFSGHFQVTWSGLGTDDG